MTVHMAIHMTDEDTLQNFYYIVPSGKVRGPYQLDRPNHKPYWTWQTTVTPAIISIWDEFRPYLSERRKEQGDLALATRYLYERDSKHFNLRLNPFPSYIIERASMLDVSAAAG